MMFTPFVFIAGHLFTGILLALALAILLRWEITYKLFPERFSTNTNRCLDCAHCPEKLCRRKRQLRSFLRRNAERFRMKENIALLSEKARKLLSRDRKGGDAPPEDKE